MHDAGKIIAGLLVFIGVMTFPFWYNMGKASPAPELELSQKAKQEKECVEPKAFMKTSHMQLLNDWRDVAVREDMRVYVGSNGKSHDISLQNTCMDCHSNKDKFCDKCHEFVGVTQLYCWDCHLDPKEKELWAAKDVNF